MGMHANAAMVFTAHTVSWNLIIANKSHVKTALRVILQRMGSTHAYAPMVSKEYDVKCKLVTYKQMYYPFLDRFKIQCIKISGSMK